MGNAIRRYGDAISMSTGGLACAGFFAYFRRLFRTSRPRASRRKAPIHLPNTPSVASESRQNLRTPALQIKNARSF
jgi:hypothetical protein